MTRTEHLRRKRLSSAKWRVENPEKAQEANRRDYKKHHERRLESARNYRRKHAKQKKTYNKAYYAKNRTAISLDVRRRAIEVRLKVLNAYGGPKCSCCGEATFAFMTLDHINGCGAAQRKAEGLGTTMYWRLIKKGFPPGYRVLCFNCNLGRRVNGGICPHATQPPT